ncbi:unnamed protein product [Nippostrongylus brasiliensis]|uniref:Secreted protein n=1 Tax=Nippostrongylus brasiliensis TaxID=27835 RepID=A0A0N4YSM5_NIPBR|nr:unnamed protein product [Nippostrongylus brasiliensis]
MHWLRCLMSLIVVGDVVVLPARRRHYRTLAALPDTRSYSPEHQHPELRPATRPADDDKTEFVRREWTETVYKKVRTYSEFCLKTRNTVGLVLCVDYRYWRVC